MQAFQTQQEYYFIDYLVSFTCHSFSTLETTEDSWLSVKITVYEYSILRHTAGHNQFKLHDNEIKKCSKIVCYVPWHHTQWKKIKRKLLMKYQHTLWNSLPISLKNIFTVLFLRQVLDGNRTKVKYLHFPMCQLQHCNEKQLFQDDFTKSSNNMQINTCKYMNTSMNLKTILEETIILVEKFTQ